MRITFPWTPTKKKMDPSHLSSFLLVVISWPARHSPHPHCDGVLTNESILLPFQTSFTHCIPPPAYTAGVRRPWLQHAAPLARDLHPQPTLIAKRQTGCPLLTVLLASPHVAPEQRTLILITFPAPSSSSIQNRSQPPHIYSLSHALNLSL